MFVGVLEVISRGSYLRPLLMMTYLRSVHPLRTLPSQEMFFTLCCILDSSRSLVSLVTLFEWVKTGRLLDQRGARGREGGGRSSHDDSW